MKSRSTLPATIQSFHLPYTDESVARRLFTEFSPVSQRNFQMLQRIFATEIDHRQMSFGYAIAAATGRWMFLATDNNAGELIGYAVCMPLDSFGQTQGLIAEIVVLPEYRHQSAAQSLITAAGAIFTLHQDPRVTTLAAIVSARRHTALDT
ncbi:MAG: GNAT family N-acetyltransferase, partial [Candidatus Moraniibacteriota bacterium]